ncbi:chromogranin-A isoform X1 [Poeciliopsis prolifica]|uniref:chromogranin-A isoform X1 n=1 Tax=Poeciliopsis prolifica TaxID=188132 RepID=UPI00241322F4|nr:chromogranin-A isoform X1 [Poeciliopsis prolifica]
MTGRGLLLLAALSTCVLSLPVTSHQLENEDVEVMKCIVEALADVLSRPKQVPVSQECLNTLKTDERLLTILRHHNFLKELQEIATQGDHERGQLHKNKEKPTTGTQVLQTTADGSDRSMLEALGGPGERSILSQKKRSGDGGGQKDGTEEESQEDDEAEEDVTRDKDEAERDEDGTSSEENSEEEDERGDRSTKREDPKQKTAGTETEERSDKRPEVFSQKHDGKEETEEQTAVKRGSRESLSHLTQRARKWQQKKKAGGEEEPRLGSRQDLSHHSKEEAVEEKQKKKRDPERTPEERELQMIARRSPEERKVMEEEGSGTRKSEEPEIESLAAIESELENVAQKLHELRRG